MTREYAFVLEAVTPLFMGGADPAVPELRAPAVRGVLRYWWRALAADHDIAHLRDREEAIFGSTRQRSPLIVRLASADRRGPASWQMSRLQGAPVRRDGPLDYRTGLNYLGFSLMMRGGNSAKAGYPARTRLRLTVDGRSSGDSGHIDQALAALWVTLFVGGLGARSRRGFGSLHAVEAPQDSALPAFRFQGGPSQLAQFLADGLRRCRALVPSGSAPSAPATYSMLRPDTARIVVFDASWPSWEEALGTIGAALQRERFGLAPTMTQVVGRGGQGTMAFPRAGFGLPIGYYDPRARTRGRVLPRSSDEVDRRASPLIIRVIRLEGGKYGIVLGLLRAEFLPSGAQIVAEPSRQMGTATLEAVERFVQTGGGITDVRGQAVRALEVPIHE